MRQVIYQGRHDFPRIRESTWGLWFDIVGLIAGPGKDTPWLSQQLSIMLTGRAVQDNLATDCGTQKEQVAHVPPVPAHAALHMENISSAYGRNIWHTNHFLWALSTKINPEAPVC
jgi:hypothetical protein